jgi:hypothetical protein
MSASCEFSGADYDVIELISAEATGTGEANYTNFIR